jgi:hypothetical protein
MNMKRMTLTILLSIFLITATFATSCTYRRNPEPTRFPINEDSAEQSGENGSPGWIEVEESLSGIRFAVPCFWIVDIPREGLSSLSYTSFSIRNYPYSPDVFSPGQDLFEEGAIKIDLVFIQRYIPGDTPIERMMAFTHARRNTESESKLLSAEEIQVNGQTALFMQTESIFGHGRHIVFELSAGTFVIFAPNFLAFDHPDVQAILASIALSEDIRVRYPGIKPALPPFGETAPCLEIIEDLANSQT